MLPRVYAADLIYLELRKVSCVVPQRKCLCTVKKRKINTRNKRSVENQLSREDQWVGERSCVPHASLLSLTLLNIWSGDLRAKTKVHA